MKRTVLLVVAAAAVALGAWSQLLWRVDGNGLSKPSYLMGTHHMAPASFIDSISGLGDALNACDAVYGELREEELSSSDAQQRMALALMAPADSTLDKVLTPSEYAVVKRVVDGCMAPMGLTAEMFNMLKPQALSLQLQLMQATMNFPDYDPKNQIDATVQRRGMAAGKELGAFETVDDQIKVLFAATIKEQAQGLVEMCEYNDDYKRVIDEQCKAYIGQDIDFLYGQVLDPGVGSTPTDAELERLVWGRNRNWVGQLVKLMPEKSIFVCVGVGHLPGDKGLIALLRGAGYTVTPVSK